MLVVKNPSVNADMGPVPGSERYPGGGNGQPLRYSGLENPHEQRSLVDYCTWGFKESDVTEQLSTHSAWHI